MTRYKLQTKELTFNSATEYTEEDIMRHFLPIEEPQDISNEQLRKEWAELQDIDPKIKEEIHKAVDYSAKKYGQAYKDFEKVDGESEIEKLQFDKLYVEGCEQLYIHELQCKLNELIKAHNSMRKSEARKGER